MNAKFIFSTLQILSILAASISTHAQTLTLTSNLPDQVQVGTTPSFTLDYTSTVPCKIIVALIRSTSDGTSPDWNTWQVGTILEDLPVTSSAITKTISVNVPSNQILSSNLPAGVSYLWALTLQDSSGVWITGSQPHTTIVASNTIIDDVSFNGALPTSVSAGSTVSIPYKYTATTERIVKIGLSKYNSAGNWIGDVISEVINPAPATTSIPISGTANLLIPFDAVPSTDLPNGEYYKWEASIATISWGYLGGTSANVTLNSNLGISEVSNVRNVIYPNPVNDLLKFSKPNEIKSFKIIDQTGRVIIEQNKYFENGVSVLHLPKGSYITIVNGKENRKVVKQ